MVRCGVSWPHFIIMGQTAMCLVCGAEQVAIFVKNNMLRDVYNFVYIYIHTHIANYSLYYIMGEGPLVAEATGALCAPMQVFHLFVSGCPPSSH